VSQDFLISFSTILKAMKTPIDCQLLNLGMSFVAGMKANDFDSVSKLIANEDCLKTAKSLIENATYKSLLQNFCTIHAIVEDIDQPKVFLQFLKSEKEKFSQTLICFIKEDAINIQVETYR
jgi:hypothetical protein